MYTAKYFSIQLHTHTKKTPLYLTKLAVIPPSNIQSIFSFPFFTVVKNVLRLDSGSTFWQEYFIGGTMSFILHHPVGFIIASYPTVSINKVYLCGPGDSLVVPV